MNVTHLNRDQANDFLKKYMQSCIKVTDISKDDEDQIYFVTISSGEDIVKEEVKKSWFGLVKKIIKKVIHKRYVTTWQYRPTNLISSALFGHVHIGLCFGRYVVPGTNNRFDFYEFDKSLLDKANQVVKLEIEKWEKKSPV